MQSNIGFVQKEKAVTIGNFLVGRLLPFRQKRSVGPFLFIDHMGPACLEAHQNIDIPPHPHIGLSTLTYLLDGAIFHQDSLGNAIQINPGEVNWMTAGRGIVHSERTPEHLRKKDQFLHGFQIWVGLPKSMEHVHPSFHHFSKEDIPYWQENDIEYKLIAGRFGHYTAPIPVHSPLYFLEIKTNTDQLIDIGDNLYGEVGIYILEGQIKTEEQIIEHRHLLIANNPKLCTFQTIGKTTIYLFGGHPFDEERYMFWNFVHSDKNKIKEAIEDWKNQNKIAFPDIPGDQKEYVPLPDYPFKLSS